MVGPLPYEVLERPALEPIAGGEKKEFLLGDCVQSAPFAHRWVGDPKLLGHSRGSAEDDNQFPDCGRAGGQPTALCIGARSVRLCRSAHSACFLLGVRDKVFNYSNEDVIGIITHI
jgi:hypothetical protein